MKKAIIVDLIGDGFGGDREEAKNQSLNLRQYHDDGGDDGDDDDDEGNYRGFDWIW